jgi:hypothetical protein
MELVDAESLEVPEAPEVPPFEALMTADPVEADPDDELEELVVEVLVGLAVPLTMTELPPLFAPLTTVLVAGDEEEVPLTTTELELVAGVVLLLVELPLDPFTTTELEYEVDGVEEVLELLVEELPFEDTTVLVVDGVELEVVWALVEVEVDGVEDEPETTVDVLELFDASESEV